MAIRSQIFHTAGGFDERFFAHMEEIDLCLRIRKMGYSVHYLGASKVWHVGGGTLDRSNPWKTFLNFRNNLLMLQKNVKPLRFALIYMTRLGLDLLAAVVFLIRGSLEDAKAVVKGHLEFHKMKSKFPTTTRIESIPFKGVTKSRKSILWDYYIMGKKNFSEL